MVKKFNYKKLVFILSIILTLIILCIIWLWITFGDRMKSYECTTYAMGTYIQQITYGKNREKAAAEASKSIVDLENLISWRKEDSDIAKINEAAGKDWLACNTKTILLLKDALGVAEHSNGAFDPTILPISAQWDFGGENQRVPTGSEISKFLPYINWKNLRINTDKNTVSLKIHYSALDLGAIGKGAACDEAVNAYKKAEVDAGIVAAGGSIGVFGTKNDRSPWRIAVRDPNTKDQNADSMGTIELSSGFVSTSGSYEKVFTENGITYHHLLNPKTGYPENNDLISVTVVHENGAISDALSTACFVLGKQDGLTLLKQYGAGGIFIDKENKVTITDNLKTKFKITSKNYTLIPR